MAEHGEDLSCQRFVELVSDYLEGALPPRSRLSCDVHQAACPDCAAYFEQLRQTVLLLGRVIDESLAPDTRDELLRRFRDRRSA